MATAVDIPGLVVEEEWGLPSMGPGERAVTARINGRLVGGLLWQVSDGIINYVQVDPDQRRKGIATRLLAKARSLDPNVRHDVEENRSETGKEWVRAVGSKTAVVGPVQHQMGVPFSDYRFSGQAHRFYIEDPEAPDYDGGNFKGSTPKTVAFLDVFDAGDWVDIAFLTTRGKFEGAGDYQRQGLAGRLVEAAYAFFAPKKIYWGQIMHDGAERLKERYRQSQPQRTGAMRTCSSLMGLRNMTGDNVMPDDVLGRGKAYIQALSTHFGVPTPEVAAEVMLASKAGDYRRVSGGSRITFYCGFPKESAFELILAHEFAHHLLWERDVYRGYDPDAAHGPDFDAALAEVLAASPRLSVAAKVARQFFPLPPKSDGPILRNWNGYSQESQQRILATYVDLVEGRLRPEPKEREPLVGLWTVKVNAADRIIVDDLPGGGWVLLGAVFDHNYALAEQQISGWLAWRQRTASRAALETVVEEFQRDYGTLLLDPVEAHDRCQVFSEEFASRCKEAGVEAEVVSGLKFGEMPEFPGQRLVLGGHFAVRVGPMVYDWTARQFDPTAPVPMVTTIDQWRNEWLRLGFRTTALSAADAYRWEQNIRNTGNVQALSRNECERLLQRILVDHGFPQGEYAEITEARSLGTSQVAWFMDTNPPTPAIALDTRMQDDITVIHEAAHILRNGPSMAGQQGGVDRDAAHDAQWLTTFKALVQVYAGEQTKKTFNRIFG